MRTPSISSFSPHFQTLSRAIKLCRRELLSELYHFIAKFQSAYADNFHCRQRKYNLIYTPKGSSADEADLAQTLTL
jgi:hypothetical protein